MHSFRFMVREDFPFEIRRAILDAHIDPTLGDQGRRCCDMYRAIICRAIADAYGKTGLEDASEHRTAVREAREFFWAGGEWFDLVFSIAGIDKAPIMRHMMTLRPVEYQSLKAPKKVLDSSGNKSKKEAPETPTKGAKNAGPKKDQTRTR